MGYRKKLIEVSLPLEEINAACTREKSIRHGHPSTLHLWWARRPLAACRAVLFASIIDDPGEEGVPLELLDAIDALPRPDAKYRDLEKEEATPAEQLARRRRYRLFTFIEKLVKWENSNDPDTLETARKLILAATGGNPPPVLDPFCGGGSIPLEAQRLGLEAHGSDLNPVAVLITKAMIEIPPKFAGMPPINPEYQAKSEAEKDLHQWVGAKGLAEDVRYYGKWMRDEAFKRIGHLYPKVKAYLDPKTGRYYSQADVDRMWADQRELMPSKPSLFPHPSELKEEELTVIAWLWARTAKCPNPACGAPVPLVRSYAISTKNDSQSWLVPTAPRSGRLGVEFAVESGQIPPGEKNQIDAGTSVYVEVDDKGKPLKKIKKLQATFLCPACRQGVLKGDQIDAIANTSGLGVQPLVVVAESKSGRVYLSVDSEQKNKAEASSDALSKVDPARLPSERCRGTFASNAQGRIYGFREFKDYFTDRQLVALTTFSDLVQEAGRKALEDAKASPHFAANPEAYAQAIKTYLAFAIDKMSDRGSTICSWDSSRSSTRNTFARQAIPMTWDFAEANFLGESTGSLDNALDSTARVLHEFCSAVQGDASQIDARSERPQKLLISTDPPYFDNIGYADLSDFFYVWLRRSLKDDYPDLFATLLTPKTPELIATPYRHLDQNQKPSRELATQYFESGLQEVFRSMRTASVPGFPTTIYYAFKQSETEDDEADAKSEDGKQTSSTGWETMLQSLVDSGFSVNGTWPTRSELANRMIASGTNALASCIVLVCRPRPDKASSVTRREFQSALKAELPDAIRKLIQGNIAPVDLAQAAIGPGMAVFSRYSSVLEADGRPMKVKTALQLINQSLSEVMEEQEGWYDEATRWAVVWFREHAFADGPYGKAETLATAKDVPVSSMVAAGIVSSGQNKVTLVSRDDLPQPYDPANDTHVTIWKACQYLAHALDTGSALAAARLLRRFRDTHGDLDVDRVRELAIALFHFADRKNWTKEAGVYNSLVFNWSDIEVQSDTDDAAWTGQAPTKTDKPKTKKERAKDSQQTLEID